MSTILYNGYACIHPTEAISVTGYQKTKNANRETTIFLTQESIDRLQRAFAFADKYNVPLGHAFWHITDNHPEPCESCKEWKRRQS